MRFKAKFYEKTGDDISYSKEGSCTFNYNDTNTNCVNKLNTKGDILIALNYDFEVRD